MTRFSLLAGMTISALTISNVVYAQTWTGAAGNSTWNNSGNWSGGVPNGSSTVIIQNVTHQPVFDDTSVASSFPKLVLNSGADLSFASGSKMTLTGASGVSLDIGSGATIEVGANAILEFDGSNMAAMIDGDLVLSASTSVIDVLQNTTFDYDTTPGSITLNATNAEIFIVAGATLTNKIDIQGNGAIQGGTDFFSPNGVLENDGVLVAKNGVLVLESDLDLLDTSLSSWNADGIGATLQLMKSAGGLLGDFRADNEGTIEIGSNVSIVTTGNAHVDADSVILLASSADMEVDDLTGVSGGEVIACGSAFVVNGTPPTGFPATMPPQISNQWFLFNGTNAGVPQSCPR
jgi:hypothetical protein